MTAISFIRAVAGALFILFLPGFAWSWVFYSKWNRDVLERIVCSLALSIALVSIAIFFSNRLLGIKINALNSFFIVFLLVIAAPLYMLLKNRGNRKELPRGRLEKWSRNSQGGN